MDGAQAFPEQQLADDPAPDREHALSTLATPGYYAREREESADIGLTAVGVVVAGGVYPVLVGLIGLAISLPQWSSALWQYIRAGEVSAFFSAVGSALWMVIFASLMGMCYAGLFTVFLFVPLLIVRLMKLSVHPVWFGAFNGGLIGALCLAPISYLLFHTGRPDELVFQIMLGPCLATIVGQMGGAWGGYKTLMLSRGGIHLAAAAEAANDRHASQTSLRAAYRFQIRHLLWVSVWLSLLLAGIRVLELPFGLTLGVLGAWLVFQAGTLALANALCRR